jgi:hypothetical protein
LNRRNVWEGSSQGGVEACELRACALLVHSGDFEDDLVFKVFAYQEGFSDTASAVDSEQFRIFRGQNAIQDELFRYTADDGLTFGQFRIPLPLSAYKNEPHRLLLAKSIEDTSPNLASVNHFWRCISKIPRQI